MSKEFVKLDLTGVTNQLPYRDYYRGRNGLVAKYIAEYMEIPYLGEANDCVEKSVYYVPPVTQERKGLLAGVVKSSTDFYGLIVDDLNQVGKSILHRSITSKVPGFYSFEFAKAVEEFVVPGATVFSRDDLEKSYRFLRRKGNFGVRLKLADKSDGHGQYCIGDIKQLGQIAEEVGNEYINNKGLVLEANVEAAKTISVGFAVIGRDIFSFLATQKNDIAPEDGRNRYMGANVKVVRGNIKELTKIVESPIEKTAVEMSGQFYNSYKSFNPIASRLSFDVIYGYDRSGVPLVGVTDITGRLGGTCPALVLAAEKFKNIENVSVVGSEVSLNYEPSIVLDSERNSIRFIDLPSLRLSARVNYKK